MALHTPLELLNTMSLSKADDLARNDNPIGSAYVLLRHRALTVPRPETPTIPKQQSYWSGLHTNDVDVEDAE